MSEENEEAEQRVAHHTLIRLANSCERAAARSKAVSRPAADLSAED